jgi:RNA polymerase sigma factor (sigma-70 family)
MGMWEKFEEMQLVEGCKNGDRIAQEIVFKRLYGRLLSTCMRYADDRDDAEDVLQMGFIKVFKNIENYKGDGSFEGWIKRIIVNTAIDSYRRKKIRPVVTDTDLTDRVGGQMEDEQEDESVYEKVPISKVMDAVQKLSPAYKAVFNLYVMEGHNHNEISEKLGISVGTSKSNLSKARFNLKKMLTPIIERISQE